MTFWFIGKILLKILLKKKNLFLQLINWDYLKNIGKIAPKVLPEDVVFISLRDYEKEERHLIEKYSMKVITSKEVRNKGAVYFFRGVIR